MEPKEFLAFLARLEKLKCNTRHSWTSSGRHESVAEHSWRLAMLAMLLKDALPEVDMDKVLRMCLIHDVGEAVTGDIPSFQKTDANEETERQAIAELLSPLPDGLRGGADRPLCRDGRPGHAGSPGLQGSGQAGGGGAAQRGPPGHLAAPGVRAQPDLWHS